MKGFDVVDRMHTGKHHKDSFEGLIEYIEIVEIAIIQK